MDKQKICDSKKKFSTKIAIEFFINDTGRDLIQDYYKCKVCGNYHITTNSKKTHSSRKFNDGTEKLDEIRLKNERKGRSRRKGKR